jgi:hypothetical protein
MPQEAYHNLFSGLEPGVFSLGVPIAQGAVLIGTAEAKEASRLKIEVDPPLITISREDNAELLQIDEVFPTITGSEKRRHILSKAVGIITLKQNKETKLWDIEKDEDLIIYDFDMMGCFLGLVSSFALKKQNEIRNPNLFPIEL